MSPERIARTRGKGDDQWLIYSKDTKALRWTAQRTNARVWGDIQVATTRGDFRGILLPRSENDDDRHIVVKLQTGYNVGIAVETILDMKEVGYREAHYKIPEKEFPVSKGKPHVKLLGHRRHDCLATGLSHRRGDSGLFSGRAVRRGAGTGGYLQSDHRKAVRRLQREYGTGAVQNSRSLLAARSKRGSMVSSSVTAPTRCTTPPRRSRSWCRIRRCRSSWSARSVPPIDRHPMPHSIFSMPPTRPRNPIWPK